MLNNWIIHHLRPVVYINIVSMNLHIMKYLTSIKKYINHTKRKECYQNEFLNIIFNLSTKNNLLYCLWLIQRKKIPNIHFPIIFGAHNLWWWIFKGKIRKGNWYSISDVWKWFDLERIFFFYFFLLDINIRINSPSSTFCLVLSFCFSHRLIFLHSKI